ncbi:hypothetical protein [Cryobacterium ruanii]|nr:hypothetical protein [Cryobacterium ruanii]
MKRMPVLAPLVEHAVIAGRRASLAGRIPRRDLALASSTMTGRPDL